MPSPRRRRCRMPHVGRADDRWRAARSRTTRRSSDTRAGTGRLAHLHACLPQAQRRVQAQLDAAEPQVAARGGAQPVGHLGPAAGGHPERRGNPSTAPSGGWWSNNSTCNAPIPGLCRRSCTSSPTLSAAEPGSLRSTVGRGSSISRKRSKSTAARAHPRADQPGLQPDRPDRGGEGADQPQQHEADEGLGREHRCSRMQHQGVKQLSCANFKPSRERPVFQPADYRDGRFGGACRCPGRARSTQAAQPSALAARAAGGRLPCRHGRRHPAASSALEHAVGGARWATPTELFRPGCGRPRARWSEPASRDRIYHVWLVGAVGALEAALRRATTQRPRTASQMIRIHQLGSRSPRVFGSSLCRQVTRRELRQALSRRP